MCIYIYIYVYTYVTMYMYVYIYIYIHTHLCIYRYIDISLSSRTKPRVLKWGSESPRAAACLDLRVPFRKAQSAIQWLRFESDTTAFETWFDLLATPTALQLCCTYETCLTYRDLNRRVSSSAHPLTRSLAITYYNTQ